MRKRPDGKLIIRPNKINKTNKLTVSSEMYHYETFSRKLIIGIWHQTKSVVLTQIFTVFLVILTFSFTEKGATFKFTFTNRNDYSVMKQIAIQIKFGINYSIHLPTIYKK